MSTSEIHERDSITFALIDAPENIVRYTIQKKKNRKKRTNREKRSGPARRQPVVTTI